MTQKGQARDTKRLLRIPCVGTLPVLMLGGLITATPVSGQTWRITPSIGLVETLTDNVNLAPKGREESDLITQITPGVRITGAGKRVRLDLNYRMHGLLYANNSSRNEVQNYLDAIANVEAVDNWLFVDARASVTQQPISAFGAQPNLTNENINNNRAETVTYHVSPYIRGRLGSTADYQLRYTWTGSTAQGNRADSNVEEWLGNVRGRPMGPLSWAIDASAQTVHRDIGRDVETRRVRGSLGYLFDPQFRASALVGWESNNYALEERSAATYGLQAEWTPTPRTRVTALGERRAFGDTHEFSIQHRTPLTTWRYTDAKGVTTFPAQLAELATGTTVYDVVNQLLLSQIPDPQARDREVRRRLQVAGFAPNLALPAQFLTTRVLLQRSRQASVGFLGARNTLILAAGVTQSRALDAFASTQADDFSTTSEVEQRSLSATLSHRLSGQSSVNFLLSRVRSTGAAPSNIESTQSAARLVLTHQIGPRTVGSLGLRHVRFDSSVAPGYRENALTASVAATF